MKAARSGQEAYRGSPTPSASRPQAHADSRCSSYVGYWVAVNCSIAEVTQTIYVTS